MPRLFAVEWSVREVRVAAAMARGGELTIESLVALPLEAGEEGKPGAAPEAIGQLLKQQGLGRGDAIVVLGRSAAELKPLTLPASPDDELPDMVRLQALREFNTLGEDWPLDYYPLPNDSPDQRSLLAAAIRPEQMAAVRTICDVCDWSPEQVLFRPCAAASRLLGEEAAGQRRVKLLVELLAGEADLTTLAGDTVVFARTARLPIDVLENPQECRGLVAEIRRTLAASIGPAGGRVEALWISGASPAHAELADKLAAELQLPCHAYDPLRGFSLSSEVRQASPALAARFSALIAALRDDVRKQPAALDFLHPRRPPAPPDRRRTYLLAGAAVGLLLLTGALYAFLQLRSMDAEIALLREENNSRLLAAAVEEARVAQRHRAEVEGWLASDIVWLDELDYLSRRLPDPRELMVTGLTATARTRGGEIRIDGLVRDPSTFDKIQVSLADPRHRFEARSRQLSKHPEYRWQFNSTVYVQPPPLPLAADLEDEIANEAAADEAAAKEASAEAAAPQGGEG